MQNNNRSWKSVAQRLGEELASVGPQDYYNLAPEQWLQWALLQVRNKEKEAPDAVTEG